MSGRRRQRCAICGAPGPLLLCLLCFSAGHTHAEAEQRAAARRLASERATRQRRDARGRFLAGGTR